jgi:putative cell wall-binding protein
VDEPAIRSAWLGATDGQSTEGTADTATVVYRASDAAKIVVDGTENDPVDAGAVTLSLGGTISGTIVADTPGLYVSACSTDPQSENECMAAITADDGTFSITGLTPNGDYTVTTDGGTGTGLVPQRVQQVWASAENAEGTPLEIKMEKGPIIEGTVTDAETGLPIAGIGVWPYPVWNRNHDLNFFESSPAEIKTDGSYTTQGLGPGVYTFGIGNGNGRYQCGWWSTEHGTVNDQDAAAGITVGTENVSGQDIKLGIRSGSSCDAFPYPDDNGGDTGGNGDNGGNTGANTGSSDAVAPTPVTSEPVVKSVPAGGTAFSTSATKPNATTPVIAKVTSPIAGDVKFTPKSGPVAPPKNSAGAYTMLGRSFVIAAPTTTPDKPLSLEFTIDDSIMPLGLAASDVIVFRDGIAVPDCKVPNATKADPDPCIVGRSSVKEMKSIRVLSSHASTWTFGVDSTPRVAGSNRYATAAALATQFGTANAVVVANGTDAKEGVDALAANYLAGRSKAPIVLAQANRVETQTLTAVKSVLKGAANPTIYVMGGTDSISAAVANQIKAAATSVATGTVTVKRIGGADRYATSALAAATPGSVTNSLKLSAGGTAATTAILASGESNADALAAGALSFAWGVPVLLTQPGVMQKAVAHAITSLKITQLIVLGGTDRVSQAVLDQAKSAGVTTIKRIAGTDRFDTSAQLYTFATGPLLDGSGDHYGTDGGAVYLANGITGFPDALAAGPLAGKSSSVLLTVRPNKLGDPAATFIKAHAGSLDSVKGLGTASTIAASVLTQASGLL